jgi:hypothetical protein
MVRFAGLAAAMLVWIPSALAEGPFGFSQGMTQEQLAKYGIVKRSQDGATIIVKSAPHGRDDVDASVIVAPPGKGLLKIAAVFRAKSNDPSCTSLRSQFEELATALTEKYGKPAHEYNFVHAGALFEKDHECMMALTREERTLATAWEFGSGTKDGLMNIIMEAEGQGFQDWQRQDHLRARWGLGVDES